MESCLAKSLSKILREDSSYRIVLDSVGKVKAETSSGMEVMVALCQQEGKLLDFSSNLNTMTIFGVEKKSSWQCKETSVNTNLQFSGALRWIIASSVVT